MRPAFVQGRSGSRRALPVFEVRETEETGLTKFPLENAKGKQTKKKNRNLRIREKGKYFRRLANPLSRKRICNSEQGGWIRLHLHNARNTIHWKERAEVFLRSFKVLFRVQRCQRCTIQDRVFKTLEL